MAINFPDSPSSGDTHVVGDKTWSWNGTYWHVKQGVGVTIWADADNDTKIQVEESSDEDIIRFDTAGTERMTIAANGAINVGGTLTAGAFSGPLTGNVTGNASGTALTVTQAAQSAITSLGTLTGLTVGGAVAITGDNDFTIGTVNTQILAAAAGSAAAGAVTYSFSGDTDTGFYRTDANKFEAATAGVSRMTWAADGNVGIGTTSPDSDLHIASTGLARIHIAGDSSGYTHSDIRLDVSDAGRGSGVYMYNSGDDSTWYMGVPYGVSDQWMVGRRAHADFQNDAADDGYAQLMITEAGNVGIGTASPDRALHVAGTFRAVGDHDDNVLLESTGTGTGIIASHTGSGTPVPWDIREDSSTDHNSASYAPLYVSRLNVTADGAGSNLQFRTKKNDGTAQEVGGLGATIDTGLTASATVTGSLHFYTTDAGTQRTEQMTIKSDGKVGIGTTSPTHTLHARGTSFLLDGYVYLGDNASSVSSVWNLYSNSSNLFLNCATGSAHYIRVNNSTAMNVNVHGISVGNGDGGTVAGTSIKAAADIMAQSGATYPVVVGVGNQANPNNLNIAVGLRALAAVSGTHNVAVGYEAMNDQLGGNWNTAVGNQCLAQATSSYNTAVGFEALYGAVTAGSNVAMGFRTGKTCVGGDNVLLGMQVSDGGTTSSSVAIGARANRQGTTGSVNVFVGTDCGTHNTTAAHNVAVGYAANYLNTTGGYNTCVGSQTSRVHTGSSALTSIGYAAGYYATGVQNTSVGAYAGHWITTGANNTMMGYYAGNGWPTTGGNNIVIGYYAAPASASVSNSITLGDANISSFRCATTSIDSLSDERDKTDIVDLDMGLDFIERLRPVRFVWDDRNVDGKHGIEDTGFIAQELQQAQADEGKTIPRLISDENPDKLEAAMGRLLPSIVLAIQELADKVEALS